MRNFYPLVLVLFALSLPLAACGGGGGDGAEDEAPEPVLLLEMLMGRGGFGTQNDPDFDISIEIGTSPVAMIVGVVGTDDDDTDIPIDPSDPNYAAFLSHLTNGAADQLVIRSVIDGGNGTSSTTDANPGILRSNELVGPDLVGATITEVVFHVESVEVVLGQGGSYDILSYLRVMGFPQ